MQLMNEGWTYSEDEDFEGNNLLPIIQKIKIIKMLQAVTDPGIMDELNDYGVMR